MSSTCYIGQRSNGLNELFFVILFWSCSSPSCDVMGCIHRSEGETLSSAEVLLKVSRRLKTPHNRISLAAMWNLEHFGGNLQQPPFCRKPTLMKTPWRLPQDRDGGVTVRMAQLPDFHGYKPTLFARLVFYFCHKQRTYGCGAVTLETKPSLSPCQNIFFQNQRQFIEWQ